MTPEKLWGDFSEKSRYDLLSVIMTCLGDSNDKNNELIGMLNTVLSEKLNVTEKEHILTTEYGIELKTAKNGVVNLMCNLSDRIERIGIEKGIEQGTLKTLFELYQDNLIPLKEAAHRVSMTEQEFLKAVQKFTL